MLIKTLSDAGNMNQNTPPSSTEPDPYRYRQHDSRRQRRKGRPSLPLPESSETSTGPVSFVRWERRGHRAVLLGPVSALRAFGSRLAITMSAALKNRRDRGTSAESTAAPRRRRREQSKCRRMRPSALIRGGECRGKFV